MPIVSVIMPAYNAAKYIGEAINSIINQSFFDWELIVIDDCSTDGTVRVVEDIMQTHENIRLIRRKENSGGCRLPRFDGILAAQGAFVCPVDSDDVVETDYLKKLVVRQQETDADIVLGRMVLVSEQMVRTGVSIPVADYDMNRIFTGIDAVKETIHGWALAMAGLLARASEYREYIQEVYESGYNGSFADEIDHRKLLLRAAKVTMTDALYYYRQLSGSIVHSVSFKSFGVLVANEQLLRLVRSVYAGDETMQIKMNNEYIEQVYRNEIRYLLNKCNFTRKEQTELEKMLKSAYDVVKKEQMHFASFKYALLSQSWFMMRLISMLTVFYVKIKH